MPLLNLFWTMLMVFLWIMWIFLFVRILMDVFRSHDMGGWHKAFWIIALVLLPFIGALIYVIARGDGMADRDIEHARMKDEQFRSYVQQAAGPRTSANDLERLAALREKGALTDEEYNREKSKVLSSV